MRHRKEKFKLELFFETLLVAFFFMIPLFVPLILLVMLVFERLFS